ncbi:hypothetical protein BC343_08040 [Mucilaginibacter pedocola]|uniref:Uncharacterized protein n=1 Tax=Mucilaginibacter pedocola TaxID=1792845 RepID=A0A1S9PC91_9SPHI|nr:hypothetical protein BC343_08040 [Mucilaginibacter pedocola]
MKHQKNQKCFQHKGFFAARAFPLQTGQNHGLGKFALAAPLSPPLQQTFPMPLQPHMPTMFCPLSPEALLLTF